LDVRLSLPVTDAVDEVSYAWDLGDGISATGENISHVYNRENSRLDVTIYANSHYNRL
jgi:PKD repeat protein